jgi:SulP family sulfate permease
VVRFDGSLYFASAGYFETKMLGVVSQYPDLKYIILDGEGINQIDATGEEVLHHLWERLQAQGIHLVVARMKKQFMDTIRRTGLREKMGDNFFSRIGLALNFVWNQLGDSYDQEHCPLRVPPNVNKD